MSNKPENNVNETFLADWLAGTITDAQLKAMVSETDFKAYEKLWFSMQAFEIGQPDMQRNFAEIQHKISEKKKTKTGRTIPLYSYAAVAAMLLLFVGLYQFFVFSNVMATGYGQTTALLLKDQTEVTLNAKSKLSYPSLFKLHRTLKLEGEAYFKVSKGSTFTVETALGNVQVLGTQFNVKAYPDYFEVQCYEGRVSVTTPTTTEILTHGKAVRVYKNNAETWETSDLSPSWVAGESNFRNTPLQMVIRQFENQYHQTVKFPERLSPIRFTGSFTHLDIDTALQSICLPMHLQYTQTNGTIIISE